MEVCENFWTSLPPGGLVERGGSWFGDGFEWDKRPEAFLCKGIQDK